MNRKHIAKELLSTLNRISFKDYLYLSLETSLRVIRTICGIFLPALLLSTAQGYTSIASAFNVLFIFILTSFIASPLESFIDMRENHLNLLLRQEVSYRLSNIDTQDFKEDNLKAIIDGTSMGDPEFRGYGSAFRRVMRYVETITYLVGFILYFIFRSPLVILILLLAMAFLKNRGKHASDIKDSYSNALKPHLERSSYFRNLRLKKGIHRDIATTKINEVLNERKKNNREAKEKIIILLEKKNWWFTFIFYIVSILFFLISLVISYFTYRKGLPGNLDISGIISVTVILIFTSIKLPHFMRVLTNWSKGMRRVLPVLDLLDIKNRDEKAFMEAFSKDEEDNSSSNSKRNFAEKIFAPEIKREKIDRIEKIEFKDVSFKYPGKNKYILENACFTLTSPIKVALTGYENSGKSTVLDLIIGLYRPTTGSILINNIPMNDVDMENYRSKLSVMFQDSVVFNLPLKENITMGREDLGEKAEEIIEKLDIKKSSEKISLENPWKSEHNLKYEDREKIALARTFVKESDVMILDEPSVSLLEEIKLTDFNKKFSPMTIIINEKLNRNVVNFDGILLCHKRMVYYFHSYQEFQDIFPDIYKDIVRE